MIDTKRWPVRVTVLLAACFSVPLLAAAQTDRREEVRDSGLQESVRVVLIEFKMLVTDKQGRPIADLRPEEVTVLEKGRPQRLAFLESWFAASSDPALAPAAALPATVYSAEGEEAPAVETIAVPPPRPVRRVVFVFDVRNSRLRIREDWRQAALEWAGKNMTPEDVASVVVLRNYPDWVLTATSERDRLVQALRTVDLFTGTPNRDRREEMTALLTDLQGLCTDIGGGPRRGSGSTAVGTGQTFTDESTCAYAISEPVVAQWEAESAEAVQALQQLTGQLAAIPGRKAVILFSEGIIPDPANIAINAMLSIWGSSTVNFRQLESSLRRETFTEIGDLQRVAAASDVVYFTMDTRSAAERGYSSELEMQVSQARGALGINPWNEMYEATRGTLSGLAHATGGRPFYGKDDLEVDVRTAADSFYGVYNVGYYRSEADTPGKLKIKVARKGARFELPEQVDFRRHEARDTRVDLAVGRPAYAGHGDFQLLPITVMASYESLPLRRGAGGRGCQLGVFLQAQRPDGSVAAERFETAVVVVSGEGAEALQGRYHDHRTALELEPGPYRLRTRVSDDFNQILGDTFIDVTVGQGTLAPGLVPPEGMPEPAGP